MTQEWSPSFAHNLEKKSFLPHRSPAPWSSGRQSATRGAACSHQCSPHSAGLLIAARESSIAALDITELHPFPSLSPWKSPTNLPVV